MDYKKILNNLTNFNLKPSDNNQRMIQIVHFYGERHFPYLPNEETKLDVFKLPEGISYNDFFKVISYYTKRLDEISSYPCSLDQAKYLEQILPYIGCTKIENSEGLKPFEIYFICGSVGLDTPKYYEWYQEGVTESDLEKIYAKYSKEFTNVFDYFLENYTPEEKGKPLVRSMLLPAKKCS